MIPAWNMSGVIPPIRPGQPGHSSDRSPYLAQLTSVVDKFSFSQERQEILRGFLAYRAALHSLGVISGFQWIDGSFLEDIEAQESRPPKDIDVVTYFYLPAGETQLSLIAKAGNLFDKKHVKETHHVDAYQNVLGGPLSSSLVRRVSYWYSMWSHRRDGTWKGFIEVDLAPHEDAPASVILASKISGGANP